MTDFDRSTARNYNIDPRCPYCQSKNFWTMPEESGWSDDGYCSTIFCPDCKKKWVEVYTFERIEEEG